MTYSICLGQDLTYYLGRRDGTGVKMQTEGKMPIEVLLYVSSKQTNLIKATRSESLHLGLA